MTLRAQATSKNRLTQILTAERPRAPLCMTVRFQVHGAILLLFFLKLLSIQKRIYVALTLLYTKIVQSASFLANFEIGINVTTHILRLLACYKVLVLFTSSDTKPKK